MGKKKGEKEILLLCSVSPAVSAVVAVISVPQGGSMSQQRVMEEMMEGDFHSSVPSWSRRVILPSALRRKSWDSQSHEIKKYFIYIPSHRGYRSV